MSKRYPTDSIPLEAEEAVVQQAAWKLHLLLVIHLMEKVQDLWEIGFITDLARPII